MVSLNAPAKINLALDVLSRRPDGYHEVDMVMQSIELCDQLTIEPWDQIELLCSNPNLPTDHHNLAWRAAKLMQEVSGITAGVKIQLQKKIPVAAGLAGGSTDAAAVLIGLNQLWKLNLTTTELMQYGTKLGADVPFCLLKGTARAEGIGERLTKIPNKLGSTVLLVTPAVEVATASVYQQLQVNSITRHPNLNRVIAALEKEDLKSLHTYWGNVLEEVVLPRVPEVVKVKEYFREFGLNSLMSGSGPSVFSIDPPENVVTEFMANLPQSWFGCVTKFWGNNN